MVTRYDIISSRRPSHFWVKKLLSAIKVKLVDITMMQSNYLCVILDVKNEKLLILTVFNWFLILDKMAADGKKISLPSYMYRQIVFCFK